MDIYGFPYTLYLDIVISDCSCNTVGTEGNASECDDNTGNCTCNESLGYSGQMCDMCKYGWLLLDDGTCRRNVYQIISMISF